MTPDSANSVVEILCNTDNKISKQQNKCKKYCWTYNNYIEEELEILEKVLIGLGLWVYGKEIGDSGTPHLQGWINLNEKMRITELKKYKEIYNIHFEKQKSNDTKAISYCLKDGKYKSNFDLSKYIQEKLDVIMELWSWQTEMLEILKQKADKRIIYWIWEPNGNMGKSEFCKYLCHHHKAIYIDEGKKSDIINIIYNKPIINSKSIVAIDIPRNNGNNISYKAIEQIKNGLICNTKYETGNKIFNAPHIIIFSNFYPEKNKLSMDRWKIGKIENKKIIWE